MAKGWYRRRPISTTPPARVGTFLGPWDVVRRVDTVPANSWHDALMSHAVQSPFLPEHYYCDRVSPDRTHLDGTHLWCHLKRGHKGKHCDFSQPVAIYWEYVQYIPPAWVQTAVMMGELGL